MGVEYVSIGLFTRVDEALETAVNLTRNLIIAVSLILASATLQRVSTADFTNSRGLDIRGMRYWTETETPYKVKWNRGRFKINFKRQKTKVSQHGI